MSRSKTALKELQPPAHRAMVFICQKCGKRAGSEFKHASHELASNVKRAAKREFEKGDVRVVLTTCMKACPEDGITVLVQRQRAPGSLFLQAAVDDPAAAAESVLQRIREE